MLLTCPRQHECGHEKWLFVVLFLYRIKFSFFISLFSMSFKFEGEKASLRNASKCFNNRLSLIELQRRYKPLPFHSMDEDEFNSVSLLSFRFFVPFSPFLTSILLSSIKYKKNSNWKLHFKRYSIRLNIKLQFLFEFVEFNIDSQSHVYESLECNWTRASGPSLKTDISGEF